MNEAAPIPIDRWATELQPVIDASQGLFKRVVVLDETDSTQDAALRIDAQIGDVILTGRQTAGRGRLGRAWADTAEDGVAMTVVMSSERPERMAIQAAVAVAFAIGATAKEQGAFRPILPRIKWPNDVLIDGRKVAGILIEQNEGRSRIGIGINVSQTQWPSELAHRAISLAEAGVVTDRITVIELVLTGLIRISQESDDDLIARYQKLEVMEGSVGVFLSSGIEHRGKVLRLEPMRGLAVQTSHGEVWLPAATTTVLDWHFPVHSD